MVTAVRGVAQITGFLGHSIIVLILGMVIVNRRQMISILSRRAHLIIYRGQVHIHIIQVALPPILLQVIDVRLRNRVCDRCSLCHDHVLPVCLLFTRRHLFRRGALFAQKHLGARNRLEVAISLALGVLGLWQDQVEDVALEFDRAEKLGVGAGAVVTPCLRAVRVLVVEKPGDEEVLAPREVLLDPLDHDGHLEDLLRVWTLLGRHLQQSLDKHAHVHGVVAGYGWVLTPENPFEQAIHVVRLEGWLQVAHFVSYAAKRPDVRFEIVWLVLPHLGAGVVRSTCLRVQKALLRDLAHI